MRAYQDVLIHLFPSANSNRGGPLTCEFRSGMKLVFRRQKGKIADLYAVLRLEAPQSIDHGFFCGHGASLVPCRLKRFRIGLSQGRISILLITFGV